MSDQLDIWTIYYNTSDLPGLYTARRSSIGRDGIIPASSVFIGKTLDGIRTTIPKGLHRLPRDPFDDPVIVEVWL